jgi:hypothetical protein
MLGRIKSYILWNIKLCSPFKVIQRREEHTSYIFKAQGICIGKEPHESGSSSLETPLTFNGQHGVMSQKIQLSNLRMDLRGYCGECCRDLSNLRTSQPTLENTVRNSQTSDRTSEPTVENAVENSQSSERTSEPLWRCCRDLSNLGENLRAYFGESCKELSDLR